MSNEQRPPKQRTYRYAEEYIPRKRSKQHEKDNTTSFRQVSKSSYESPNDLRDAPDSLYRYDNDDIGKVLTKTQIKKALISCPERESFVNQNLTDEQIKSFVHNILTKRSSLTAEAANKVLSPEGIRTMRQAFTHWTCTNEPNYEMMEFLGDTTYNKALTYYMYRRFPSLANDPDGNSRLSEATKLYKSKQQAPIFCDLLGLPSMARYRTLCYQPQKESNPNLILQITMDNKMKTDLFEAFVGAIELLIDNSVFMHTGYFIIYQILKSLFDKIDMTIDKAKTKPNRVKVKEIMDHKGTYKFFRYPQENGEGFNVKLSLDFTVPLQGKTRTHKFINFTQGPSRNCELLEDRLCLEALHWLKEECNIEYETFRR